MTKSYKFSYNCGDIARRFHLDEGSEVKLLIGPFGTGKTTSAAYDQVMLQSRRVLAGEGGVKRSRFAVVRNTLPQLRDTTMKTFLDWFPPAVFGKFWEAEKRYVIKMNESGEKREVEVLFRALDIEKDVRNLLSLELTGAWADEAREINYHVFLGMLGRVGRYPARKDFGKDPFEAPPQVLLTTNYPNREHWLYRDFVKSGKEGYSIFEQGQVENKHNLRDGYYESLEKHYAERPDLLRTLVRGEWGVTIVGKEVYPEFSRQFHVAGEGLVSGVVGATKDGGQIIRGWDNTGLSPACVITFINSTGQWLWIKEFCGDDIGIVEFGEMVKLWCGQTFSTRVTYRDIGDPAGTHRDTKKMSPTDYLRQECNIYIEDGLQNFKVRRESVANRLRMQRNGEAALVIDPSCIRVIDGFEGGYAYPEIGNSGVFKPEPEKSLYSHIHDAGQYPATVLFGGGVNVLDERDLVPEFAGME